jgi:cyclopropane fatty-acyl-phospholipid synthase-like methyltransferase
MKLRGWDVEGVEPSTCGFFAEKFYKHKIQHLFLEDYSDFEKKYDLVTCLSTLEHVFNPRQFLSSLVERVNQGGRVFIVVPLRSYAVEHITMFTSLGLKMMFDELGFKIISLKEHKGCVFVLAERSSFNTLLEGYQ